MTKRRMLGSSYRGRKARRSGHRNASASAAERRLGELIAEAKEKDWIREGRPKTVPTQEQFSLHEAGIDRKLSSRAQKLAALAAPEFESHLAEAIQRIVSGDATIINGARAVMANSAT